MRFSTHAARWGVALLLCLPAAVSCDDPGDDQGAGPGGGVNGGAVPGPGGAGASGGSSGGNNGGAKPGPLRIPDWGRSDRLHDDASEEGRFNWAALKRRFVEVCGDGTLCVDLVRVNRTADGRETAGPCGYDHMEPRSGRTVERHRIVYVVGVCEPDPNGTDEGPTGGPTTDGPTEGTTDGPTDGTTDGSTEESTDGPTGGSSRTASTASTGTGSSSGGSAAAR
ncbi:hypothetical protein [Streptomyces fradiae]|uniref:hypothetical protein n=1 Tax=Streptomyces fradiae TaxID=1906 RepID=UPI0035166AEC